MMSAGRPASPTALGQQMVGQKTNKTKSDRLCNSDWLAQALPYTNWTACIMQPRLGARLVGSPLAIHSRT
jgi:hypothetical protein